MMTATLGMTGPPQEVRPAAREMRQDRGGPPAGSGFSRNKPAPVDLARALREAEARFASFGDISTDVMRRVEREVDLEESRLEV